MESLAIWLSEVEVGSVIDAGKLMGGVTDEQVKATVDKVEQDKVTMSLTFFGIPVGMAVATMNEEGVSWHLS